MPWGIYNSWGIDNSSKSYLLMLDKPTKLRSKVPARNGTESSNEKLKRLSGAWA